MSSAEESRAPPNDERAKAKNADDPPHHLNDDARSKWRETWSRLDRSRFDASHDWDVLAEYCEAWADIRQAENEIKRHAQIAKANTGTGMREQPSGKASSFYELRWTAMERFDRAAEKLGLSIDRPKSSPWSEYAYLLEPFPPELAAQDQKETNSTTHGRRRIWTRKRVWDALQRSFGNMAAAARLLSETYGVTCARSTISLLVKEHPQLRAAIADSEQTLLDLCYGALFKSSIAGDPLSQQFVLIKLHPRFRD